VLRSPIRIQPGAGPLAARGAVAAEGEVSEKEEAR
jgi:hypothetical protein